MSTHPIGPYPPPSYPLSPRPTAAKTATVEAVPSSTHTTPTATPRPPDLPVTGPGGLLIAALIILIAGAGLFLLFRRR